MPRDDFDAILVGALAIRACPTCVMPETFCSARFELDLYINYRPVKPLADRLVRRRSTKDVNFVASRKHRGRLRRHGGRF
jgi:isocitrate/isopropylmalate dehydrogenase